MPAGAPQKHQTLRYLCPELRGCSARGMRGDGASVCGRRPPRARGVDQPEMQAFSLNSAQGKHPVGSRLLFARPAVRCRIGSPRPIHPSHFRGSHPFMTTDLQWGLTLRPRGRSRTQLNRVIGLSRMGSSLSPAKPWGLCAAGRRSSLALHQRPRTYREGPPRHVTRDGDRVT